MKYSRKCFEWPTEEMRLLAKYEQLETVVLQLCKLHDRVNMRPRIAAIKQLLEDTFETK